MKAQLRVALNVTGARLTLWCPGCDGLHQVQVRGEDGSVPPGPEWGWNRDLVNVTITPSILVRHGDQPDAARCHSFVTDGHWQFLGDSTHRLAGQTVPLVDLPEWFVR